MLLGVEEAPSAAERRGDLGAKQAVDGWISIGQMPASDFIVSVILEARHAAELRIQCRRSIPSFRKNADRLAGLL